MKLPELPNTKRPDKPTKQEVQRVLLCAYRRKLPLNAFITKLVRRQFSLDEQRKIMSELGEDLCDRMFEFATRKRS